MMTPYAYVYLNPRMFPDEERWGRAVSFSAFLHALLLAFSFMLVAHRPVVKTVLTEVNFMEKTVPIPQEKMPPPPGVSESVSGGSSLGHPGKAVTGESRPDLKTVLPYSSPEGSPEGGIVTSKPMSGPIVPAENFGVVGRKKGSLAPLAGRTEGKKSVELFELPRTSGKARREETIALSVEDMGHIRKKETSIGAPLLSRKILDSSMGGKIKRLADSALGKPRTAGEEKLKANPLEREKWGKQKGPFSMEGPLKYRRIVRMELPPYPRWAEEQGVEASVSIRLWVDPKGKVKDALYLEKASGYSELDYLAKEAIRKFVFVTIPEDLPQEDEWGIATFRFELKK